MSQNHVTLHLYFIVNDKKVLYSLPIWMFPLSYTIIKHSWYISQKVVAQLLYCVSITFSFAHMHTERQSNTIFHGSDYTILLCSRHGIAGLLLFYVVNRKLNCYSISISLTIRQNLEALIINYNSSSVLSKCHIMFLIRCN